MRRIPAMTDMRRSADDGSPEYPWGLCLRLSQEELDKLNLDDDVNIGDLLHFAAMARITSISKSDSADNGPCCNIEMQIIEMTAVEDEDDESADMITATKATKALYGG